MSSPNKPECRFGINCYRKNLTHLENYSHPSKVPGDNSSIKYCPPPKKIKLQKEKKPQINSIGKKPIKKTPPPLIFKTRTGKPHCELNESSSKTSKNLRNKKQKDYDNIASSDSTGHQANVKKNIVKDSKEKSGDNSDLNISSDDVEDYNTDSETVQSTSWVFVKKPVEKIASDVAEENFKGKSEKEIIKTLFLVNMPDDFYSFFEFCKSLDQNSPLTALQFCGIKLVGPFDVLTGKINDFPEQSALCHWRFFYDPPEFQTLIATDTEFHLGYWRDEPKDDPQFVASNDSSKNCVFKIESESIFGAVLNYIENFIKTCNPFLKMKSNKVKTALKEWAEKNGFSLEMKTNKILARQKKVVSKTFHGAGIVVPVEAKTEIGYRPLIETPANLKKICKLIADADDENEREVLWENLQPLITAANIANDECDFGNSLELGINLFCMGSPVFHETVEYLLTTAYSLLKRPEFEEIIKAHIHNRKKVSGSTVKTLSKSQTL